MANFNGTGIDDVYNGTEDSDTVHGGGGNDTLNGKGGTDFLYGDDGNDTISGGDDTDFIYGGAGADNLSGDGGDDRFIVTDASELAAGEVIDGGPGFDLITFQFGQGTVDLSNLTIRNVEGLQAMNAYLGTVSMTAAQLSGFTLYLDVFTIQLTTGGTAKIGGTVDGRHININLANAATTLDLRDDPSNYGSSVTGGSADDIIYGSTQYADHIFGGGGNDFITGGSSRDGLTGGDGNDHIEGGGNDDRLYGNDGNDELFGGEGYDEIDGGAGLDKLYGGDTDDLLIIGAASDVVAGEVYDGGAGQDTLSLSGGTYDLSTVSLVSIERLANSGLAILSTAQIANGFTYLSGNISFSTTGAVTLGGSYDNVNFILNAGGNSLNASGAASGIRVTGSGVADTIVGSSHDDALEGGGGVDSISGGDGNDVITGGAGADTLSGGAGNDIIVYYGASDLVAGEAIDGGADFDILRLSLSQSTYTLDLTGATMTGIEGIDTGPYSVAAMLTAAQFDALTAVSGNFILATGGAVTMAGVVPAGDSQNGSITLSAAGNTLDMTGYNVPFTNVFGQGGVDVITGSAGTDNIYGGGANDIIDGGIGNDVIHGGLGADQLSGGEGDDVFVLDAANEFVAGESYNGGAGFDILQTGNFTVDVSAGDLSQLDGIDARFGTVKLTAAQLDALTAVTGNFELTTTGTVLMSGVTNAANGGSTFTLFSGGNTFDLTGYDVSFAQVNGAAGADTIIGSAGTDWLIGNGGDDMLRGAGGNDLLDGGKGNNVIDGGAGLDAASVDFSDRSGAVVLVNAGAAGVTYAATVGGAAAGSVTDVEMLSIIGGSGNDRIGGHYVPAPFNGTMTLNGGGGTDTAVVDFSGFGGTVGGTLAGGGLTLFGGGLNGPATFLLTSIEALEFTGNTNTGGVTGGALADTLRGLDGNDVFNGGGGDDILIGGGGIDRLNGGTGNDQMYGGFGNDSYFVDSQGDVVFEGATQGNDTVTASTSYYLYANVETLILNLGAGDIFGVGNDSDNMIYGNEGANLILGGSGNDEIHGGTGNDQLYGQDGVDSINGDSGVDYLIGGAGNDVLYGGDDSDALYGEEGDDLLEGGADFKTDILIGGDGNDTLRGDSGLGDYDEMDGGAGNDIYIVDTYADVTYEAAGGGTDLVLASTAAGSGYYLYANVENLTLIGDTFYGVGNELANTMTGNSGANWLLGGAGNDVLNGKAGNDVLFGQDGADVFVFEVGTGGDTITDFVAGTDRIDLSAFGYTSLAQVQAQMVENGGSTAIQLGTPGDFIVLQGVGNAALHAGDFIFAGGSSAGTPFAEQRVADETASRGGLIHHIDDPHISLLF